MGVKTVTSLNVGEFVEHISTQDHAMAGAAIALSAAQATALGEACLRISSNLTNGSDKLLRDGAENISHIKNNLLDLCQEDAQAISQFVALREAGEMLSGQQMLCHLPSEISRLSIKAGLILQECRSVVHERVADDLEMSLTLLSGTAQAALLLLDSNLRIWPLPDLVDEFEPIYQKREMEISALQPVKRLRGKS